MQYDFDRTKKRVIDIEGGYDTVAARLNVSPQRLKKILDGTTNPKLSTMTRINEVLRDLEKLQDEVVKQNPEIFLPFNGLNSPI
jgi:predicted transcriptional regulator